jgi:hypothetical protein
MWRYSTYAEAERGHQEAVTQAQIAAAVQTDRQQGGCWLRLARIVAPRFGAGLELTASSAARLSSVK